MTRKRLKRIVTMVLLVTTLLLPLEAFSRPGRGGGGGGGGGASFSRGGAGAGGSFRGGHSNRGNNRHDNRGDRRDDRHDNRNDRQDHRQDRRRGRHHERHEWHADRWKRRMGAHLTLAAFHALSCASRTVVVNGVSYYGCGGTWYNRRYVSGQVTYVVVQAPPGQ